MLSIHRLMPQDAATAQRWDIFVMACPQATFFHRAGWQRMVGEVFQHDTYYLYAEEEGVIVGVLPLGHVNSWLFGNALTSLPFAVYGGVAASHPQAAQALVQEAQQIAKGLVFLAVVLADSALRRS